MAEFERVPLRPRPTRNWLPTAGLGFAIFLAVAIVKPWGSPPQTAGDATPLPTFYIAPTEQTGPRDYDPRLFGYREPDPAWELWPAGYVVQFGLAGPLRVHGQDGASLPPGPGASGGPGSSAVPGRSTPPGSAPSPTAPARTEPPPEPGVVDLGPADHLVALGINTPRDVRVEQVTLWDLDVSGPPQTLPIVRLPTLWESTHFIVIAPEAEDGSGQPAAWEPGHYRLDLTTTTMEVREVLLRVRPALG